LLITSVHDSTELTLHEGRNPGSSSRRNLSTVITKEASTPSAPVTTSAQARARPAPSGPPAARDRAPPRGVSSVLAGSATGCDIGVGLLSLAVPDAYRRGAGGPEDGHRDAAAAGEGHEMRGGVPSAGRRPVPDGHHLPAGRDELLVGAHGGV